MFCNNATHCLPINILTYTSTTTSMAHNTYSHIHASMPTSMTAKTCGNKDGFDTKVYCGSRFSAKLGSTPCTICNDDQSECCTRMLFVYVHIYFTMSSIQTVSHSLAPKHAWQLRHVVTKTDPV